MAVAALAEGVGLVEDRGDAALLVQGWEWSSSARHLARWCLTRGLFAGTAEMASAGESEPRDSECERADLRVQIEHE